MATQVIFKEVIPNSCLTAFNYILTNADSYISGCILYNSCVDHFII